MERVDIAIRSDNFSEKIDKLKKIYNISTKSKLIEHIVDLEMQRFWFLSHVEKEEKKE